MKIIFIAGPFRGDGSKEAKLKNIEVAQEYVRKFIELDIPFYSPHLNINLVAVTIDENKGNYAIATNHAFLDRCDALAVLPDWKDSTGTVEEVEKAKEQGKEIFYLEEEGVFEKMKAYISN